jgi:hypothetical protein
VPGHLDVLQNKQFANTKAKKNSPGHWGNGNVLSGVHEEGSWW